MDQQDVSAVLPALVAAAQTGQAVEEAKARRLAERVEVLSEIARPEGNLRHSAELVAAEKQLVETKKRANLLKTTGMINPFEPGKDLELAERAVDALGPMLAQAEFAELPATPLARGAVAHAVKHAQTHAKCTRLAFATAQYRLDLHLEHWPPEVARAGEEFPAHAAVASGALEDLEALTDAARLDLTRKGLEAADAADFAPKDEAAARVAAEKRFAGHMEQEALELAELGEQARRLEVVASLGAVPSEAPLCRLVWHTLTEICGAADTVEGFSAFPDACELSFVKTLLKGGLADFNDIGVSESAERVAEVPHVTLRYCTASLGDDGTLCVRTEWNSGKDSELRLYNLRSGRSAVLRVPRILWACVFKGDVYIGIARAKSLRFAAVDAVLDGLALNEFSEFEVPGEVHAAATDRVSDGWLVFLTGALSRTLVRVDLRTRAAEVIECDRELTSVGPLTGIRVPGVLCVARESGGDWASVAVFEDGRTEEVAQKLWEYPALLPSAAAPADLARAAVIDEWPTLAFRERVEMLTDPAQPYDRSLVRVYRDVFLCFDEGACSWRALRIAVP